MALVKKDYGLIYNDDGSLCVTVHEDDVPFPGVKSFAVEEGTSNIITDPTFSQGILQANYQSAVRGTLSITSGVTPFGQVGNLLTLTSTDTDAYTAPYNYSLSSATENDEFYVSFYVKSNTPTSGNRAYVFFLDDTPSFTGIQSKYYSTTTSWQRIILGPFTAPANTTGVNTRLGIANSGNTFYFYGWQLEKKPFPTSFVDGTRQDGNLRYYPNIDGKNFVLNMWAKNAGRSTANSWDFLLTLFKAPDASENNHISIRGQAPASNSEITSLYVDIVDSQGTSLHIDLADFLTTIQNWHMYTIVVDNNTVSVFVDGKIIGTETTTNDFLPNSNDIVLGGWSILGYSTAYSSSTKIANLFIGKYRDSNGNIIWTDDYIKAVYKAKRPINYGRLW